MAMFFDTYFTPTADFDTLVGGSCLLSYRGKISVDYPEPREILTTLLPPSERRDFWDVGTVYTAVRRPNRFVSLPGERGR